MNKQALIEKIFESGLCTTKTNAEEVCNIVFDSIKESVKNGDKVSIAGFGIFQKKVAGPRTARNPKTGEKVQVPACSKVKFSVGKTFKEFIQ